MKRAQRPTVKGCPPGARSPCPISSTLDLVGDKWTLLVVRDAMLFGKTRFAEFAASPEGIPTNILADRLRRLELSEIFEKVAYQKHPPRYEYRLTQKGKELFPVLEQMIHWGKRHLPGIGSAPPGTLEKIKKALFAKRD